MLKDSVCKLCGSITFPLELDDVTLYRCSKCELISDNIMYDDAFLAQLYAEMYSGSSYYNAHLDEHNKLVEGKNVKLGWHKKKALEIINKAARNKSGLHVFEFGAGVGVIATYYKNNKKVKYTGIELDKNATNLAKQRGCNIRQGSITDDNIDSNLYDIVFSFEVVEHIVDLKKAIDNARSLLKEDGLFIFSTPNFYRKKNYKDKKLHQEAPPVHINFFTKDNVQLIFRQLGMNVVAINERPYPFLSSPVSHWIRTFLGKYHGATLVAVVTKN